MEIYTLLWTTVKQVFNRVNSVHNSRFLRVVKLEFGSFDFYEVRGTGELTGTLITKK